ncbi:MAG TPA: glycoside hydrolase family 3 C-terminal domain-containing protein [Candidatus Dormibacteraeota bacterium]
MLTATGRVEELLGRLTLDEKALLTAGDDVWHLPAIPRVGLGRLKMSDGPSGVRGESRGTRRSLSFPCGIAAGSTWDVDLLNRYGAGLAAEARSKGVHVLLGPTICVQRVPVAGRTFESFSEDPLLTAELAVAYIRGVQSQGVAACAKHFACNDQEFERLTISAEVDEKTLREIHLPAFEAAVREAGVWAVMSAYNRVNGTYCGEHPWLLGEVLKGEWGFDGVVVSDWLGTHSTAPAALAGLDIEMPGPPQHLGPLLADAVRAGKVPEAVLEDHCRRVLRLAERTGLLDEPAPAVEAEDDDPERRRLARNLAISGAVLLRNDGLLPLTGARKLAVIGPNAERLEPGGGGSSTVIPLQRTSLLEALRAQFPGVEVVHEEGCRIDHDVPVLRTGLIPEGLAVEYFANREWAGPPAATDRVWTGQYVAFGTPWPGDAGSAFSMRARGAFKPDRDGPWELSLANTGAARVLLDGAVVIDNTKPEPGESLYGFGSTTLRTTVELEGGRAYELLIELDSDATIVAGYRLGARPPARPNGIARAAAAAASADAVVLVVGNNPDWETEGKDRESLALPGEQDELVRQVLAANPRTAVVVNAGAPIAMPWADDTGALLVLWYPGEEGAAALAEMLAGASEPGGRLPISFPKRLEDLTAFAAYPGSDGAVRYEEGSLIGYRDLDARGIEPTFCFGHGLGYTHFEFGEPEVTQSGGEVRLSVPVTNTGERPGSEVVQVYVGAELKGFAKVALEPAATAPVEVTLDERAFRRWDGGWRVEPGERELRIGASSRDIRRRVTVTLP